MEPKKKRAGQQRKFPFRTVAAGTPFLCVKLIISISAHRSRGGRHGAGCTGCRAVEGKKGKRLFYLRNYMRGKEETERLEISSSSRESRKGNLFHPSSNLESFRNFPPTEARYREPQSISSLASCKKSH